MRFDEFEQYVVDLTNLEFAERDAQIRKQSTEIKQEMNARGLLNSSITLQKFSEFFLFEYENRCDYAARLVTTNSSRIDIDSDDDPVTRAKLIFQSVSKNQSENLFVSFRKLTSDLREALLNEAMTIEIDGIFNEGIVRRTQKIIKQVEFEMKTIVYAKKDKKSIWLLTPNFYGLGVDIPELRRRIFG